MQGELDKCVLDLAAAAASRPAEVVGGKSKATAGNLSSSSSAACCSWCFRVVCMSDLVCFLPSRREVGDTVGTVNLKLVKHVARKLEVPDKPRHGRHLKWDKYGSCSLRGK